MAEARFAVGIDLGTTNCVMSAIDLELKTRFPDIHNVPVYQRLDEELKGESTRLPSFLFSPTERQKEQLVLEDLDPEGWVLGEAAAELGRRVPGRLVTSAKSWLCHQRINPSEKILPWSAGDDMEKLSPFQATVWILEHLKSAWKRAEISQETDLADQVLTVTLPASFDQSARQWTLEACKKAGLGHAKLLEEPQAAFYAWITLRKGRWGEALKGGRRILVCDVGGGTSDFSLMQGIEEGEQFRFERLAVGDHLLLGGDNVDLALAHFAESKLSGQKSKLNASQWHLLSQLARRAKETLLSDPELNEVTLRLPGAGRKVIGGLRQATITREELNQLVLEGFYPKVGDDYEPRSKVGLSEMGLPYEAEPAVTWHILDFIRKHGNEASYPDWVLFNGGSLEPDSIRERILEVLNDHAPNTNHSVGVLEGDSLANAVARGAAYYSFTSSQGGLRIGGGSAHAYYLGLGGEQEKQVCMIPKGTEAHESLSLGLKGLEVRTNHPVSFSIFESDQHPLDEVGTLRQLDGLKPSGHLNTLVRFGRQGEKNIPVEVKGELTELDTLQLKLSSLNTDHQWELEFDLRRGQGTSPDEPNTNDVSKFEWPFELSSWLEEQLQVQQPKSIIKQLEKKLDIYKSDWNLYLLRDLADVLLEQSNLVQKSPQHESMFLAALSFSMRPGIGHPQDELRRQKIWSLYRSAPKFAREVRSKAEWSILWRRMAIGLEAGRQEDLYGRTKKSLFDKKGLPLFKGEAAEIWRMVASFEHITKKDKKRLGDALVKALNLKLEKSQLELSLWAISRFGSRLPLQASPTTVPSFSEIEPWVSEILAHPEWKEFGASQALMELCRKCGDRGLDLKDEFRGKVEEYFSNDEKLDNNLWQKALDQVERRDMSEHQQILGESLPGGLELNLN